MPRNKNNPSPGQGAKQPASAPAFKFSRLGVMVTLVVVLGIVAFIRLRVLNMPLERDEGEFAYAAQLLSQGVSPYEGAYCTMLKLPGTFICYALSMAVFGQTPWGIHLGLVLVNLATAVLLFVMARRIVGDAGGVVAAGAFGLLSIVPDTLALAAHATHFVMLPALGGILLLQRLDGNTRLSRIFLAGFLMGLAFWMKQSGALFGFFAAAWILYCEWTAAARSASRAAKRMALFALGALLPLAGTAIVAAGIGDFHIFWFWGFVYAAAHGGVLPWESGLAGMIGAVARQFLAAPAFWSLALVGLILLFCDPALREWRAFTAGFAVFSFLAVCPGWYFRGHYFIQFIPALGLLCGVAFQAAVDLLARRKAFANPWPLVALIFAMAAVSSLIQWSGIYFELTPVEACRAIYGVNPFPEAVVIGQYLCEHCPPNARIAVIGSEPEIFFYSHRRSATGHVCTYPLVEDQPYAAKMRDQLIREVSQADPEFVVFVNVSGSWVQSTAKINTQLFDWFDQYREQRLKLIGLVEITPGQPTQYRWFENEDSSSEVKSTALDWIAVFQKRTSAARDRPGK
jgi:hypothetical protein